MENKKIIDKTKNSTYNICTDIGCFQWNIAKNTANIEKHGVSFEEALTAFDDISALYITDNVHSEAEQRYFVIGMSEKLNILVVSHCIRGNDDIIRIISARKAEKAEVGIYEQYSNRITRK